MVNYIYITFVSEKGMTIDVDCHFNTAENALGQKQNSIIINEDDEEKVMEQILKSKKSLSPSIQRSIISDNIRNAWNHTTENKLA